MTGVMGRRTLTWWDYDRAEQIKRQDARQLIGFPLGSGGSAAG